MKGRRRFLAGLAAAAVAGRLPGARVLLVEQAEPGHEPVEHTIRFAMDEWRDRYPGVDLKTVRMNRAMEKRLRTSMERGSRFRVGSWRDPAAKPDIVFVYHAYHCRVVPDSSIRPYTVRLEAA